MAECRNFLDDCRSSPSMCRASSSAERMSPAMGASSDEEDGLHNSTGLELRLALVAKPAREQHHMMVRPIPLYPKVLVSQRSESFALEDGALLSMGTQAVPPSAANDNKGNLIFHTGVGSAFSTPRFLRDQVRQTLDRGNAALGDQDLGSEPISDAPSSLWSRRSASMQITMPQHDVSDAMPHPIRRSSSINGIPEGLIISRHDSLSSHPCMNERSARGLPSCHVALEWQMKKEVQAHRRLEARKRRRLQVEEKHQKNVLQRQNSKQHISPTEKGTPQLYTRGLLTPGRNEQEWQDQGARGDAAVRDEDVSMAAAQATSFSETESIGSEEGNAEAGSKLESPSPSHKSSTESNNGTATALASLPVSILMCDLRAEPSVKSSSAITNKTGTTSRTGFTLSAAKSSDFCGTMSFIVKKSVGAFSEGRWKTGDEISDMSSIRRTASNINQVLSEPPCSFKAAGSRSSAASSQQKFANMRQEGQVGNVKEHEGSCPDQFLHLKMGTIDCNSPFSQMENPRLLHLKGPGLVQDASALGIANKVKEEAMELCGVDIANNVKKEAESRDGDVEAPKPHLTGIDRQHSCPFPELPWVSATGNGPNGKTINGVMYICSGSVRLVCRCHGKHMSPAEFVEHSGSTDLSNPMRSIIVNACGSFNEVAV